MIIHIGSDHAGFPLKKEVLDFLIKNGHTVSDVGTFSLESCDYPDYAHAVAAAVANSVEQRQTEQQETEQQQTEQQETERGILICGSGQGVMMAANKHKNVRAALAWTAEIAHLAREHNDANILCLPARFITEQTAIAIVVDFLETPFAAGRHQLRVTKIDY
jgi:ribose 5-phosphate isomerase B